MSRPQRFLAVVKERPGLASPDVAKITGMSLRDAQNTAADLVRKERIRGELREWKDGRELTHYWPVNGHRQKPPAPARPRRKRNIARLYRAPWEPSPVRQWTQAEIDALNEQLAGEERPQQSSRRRIEPSAVTLYIAEHPGCTGKEVAQALGFATLKPTLRMLAERGSIHRRRYAHGEFRYWCGELPPDDEENT